MRIHCTYSYTHFNGKPGALALRSDETTVPFVGTFRTGVGYGRGSAGEAALPPPRLMPPAPRLFMNGRRPYWMNCVHGAVGRYFRGRAALGVRGAEAGSGLWALAVPNFAARAAATDVLVYQASCEIPPRSRIRELGFRSARVAPSGCRPLLFCNGMCTLILQHYDAEIMNDAFVIMRKAMAS